MVRICSIVSCMEDLGFTFRTNHAVLSTDPDTEQ